MFLYFMSDNFFSLHCAMLLLLFFSLDSSFEVLNTFLCALNLPRDATISQRRRRRRRLCSCYVYACAGICDRRKISSTSTRILMYAPVCLMSHVPVYRYDFVSYIHLHRAIAIKRIHLAAIEITRTHSRIHTNF